MPSTRSRLQAPYAPRRRQVPRGRDPPLPPSARSSRTSIRRTISTPSPYTSSARSMNASWQRRCRHGEAGSHRAQAESQGWRRVLHAELYRSVQSSGKPSAGSSGARVPTQIAQECAFADIACGSGSFLLGVFDLLLTYHGHYYNENPKKSPRRRLRHSGRQDSTCHSARNAKSCSTTSRSGHRRPSRRGLPAISLPQAAQG